MRLGIVLSIILALLGGRVTVVSEGCGDSATADVDGDGYTPNEGDCSDVDNFIHPRRAESCNGVDDDCNGLVDDSIFSAYFRDADGDGFGTPTLTTCIATTGYVKQRGDCNDSDHLIYPGASDVTDDDIDQDCGGTTGADPHVGLNALSYATVQEALTAADDGTTVWMGTVQVFGVDLSLNNKTVRLAAVSSSGATIDAAYYYGRSFTLDESEGVYNAHFILDGLTITHGGDEYNGGAISVYGASNSIELRYCTLTDNAAAHWGGAIYVTAGAAITLIGTVVSYNTAGVWGGGLMADSTDTVIIADATFQENIANYTGGGIHLYDVRADIRHTHFWENTAEEYGGGGLATAYSDITVFNCNFRGNEVGYDGGGLQLVDSTGVLSNIGVGSNVAYQGAGISLVDSSPVITNALVVQNTATNGGGGISLEATSAPELSYVTVAYNTATNAGGISVRGTDSAPWLTNSIVAFNSAVDLAYEYTGRGVESQVTYTDVHDTSGSVTNFTLDATNLQIDPLFQGDWEYHLSLASPLLFASSENLGDDFSQIGGYGGYGMLDWDADHDTQRRYWWPGIFEDIPDGESPEDYDCNDEGYTCLP